MTPMDSDKKQRMIDKILKLLELGKESNGAYTPEQQSANEMASRLMAEYAIDFSDLQHAPKKGDMKRVDVDPIDDRYSHWEGMLANCMADVFDCKVVRTSKPGSWGLSFLGVKSDLEIAIFFYRHLRMTVCRKAEINYKKIKEQDAYAYGMVATINDRMKQLYKMRQEVMTSDCRDLVVVKTDAVKEFVHEQFPNLRRGRSFRVTDTGALSHGRKDGHDVNLNRPVGYEHTPKPRLSRGH